MRKLNAVRLILAILIGIVLATLIGCNHIDSGRVIRKVNNARYTAIEWVTYVDHNGDSVSTFKEVVHPETFLIYIKSGDVTRELSVSKDLYSTYNVGDALQMHPAETVVEDLNEQQ